jgi:putative DNA primase/helicase
MLTKRKQAKPPLQKPKFLAPQPNTIPQLLKDKPQWVAWKSVDRDGKLTKPPVDYKTGRFALTDKPGTWGTFDQAWKAYKTSSSSLCGIGYVFTEEDGLIGFDLDGARDPQTGKPAKWAQHIIDELESFTEVSVSGTGYHIIVKASLDIEAAKRSFKFQEEANLGGKTAQVEIFKTKAYFTIVGGEREIEERTGKAHEILNRLKDMKKKKKDKSGKTTVKKPKSKKIKRAKKKTDEEVLSRALEDSKFKRLWNSTPDGQRDSEEDFALLNKLAYFTNKDEAQMKRLASDSKRKREKWDSPRGNETWIDKEIAKVIATFRNEISSPKANTYRLTEGGNGERFADTFNNQVKFCNAIKGGWFVWNEKYWEKDETLKIQVMAKKILESLLNEAMQDEERRDSLLKHYSRSHNQRGINGMLNYARSEEGIPVRIQDFDQHRHLLNLENGTYNTLNGNFREHRSTEMISKIAPVKYLPNAPLPSLWISFLNKIFCQDQELIDFVQRALGYSLTGETSERCIFFLHGGGRNGKSTLLSVIQAMLGTPDENGYSLQTPTETLMQRKEKGVSNDIARLKGARLVAASESAEDRRLDEGLIKQLAGGEDTMTARFLHGEFFEYKPEMKLWFASNHKPQIRGTDDAIWDRIRLIPFNYRISEQEKDGKLLGKLRKELPGILNWALEGLRQWRTDGLQAPRIVKTAVDDYRQSQDVLGDFLQEHTSKDRRKSCSVKELYNTYKKYCEEGGEKALSKNRLGKILRERGFSTGRKERGIRYWEGFGLMTNAHWAAQGGRQEEIR